MRFLHCLFLLVVVLLGFSPDLHAQGEDLERARRQLASDSAKHWRYSVFTGLTITQTSFDNWAAGGVNNTAIIALGNMAWQYKRGDWTWDNLVDLAYGQVKNEGERMRKNEDRLDYLTKLGLRINDKWDWTARLNLKTQLAEGFIPPNDTTVVSRFFAPAYLNVSLGWNYKPTDGLSIFLSPATGRFTFVLDQELADRGLYGVRPAERDAEGNIIRPGKRVREELGAMIAVLYKKDWKKVGVQSRLELFNNYLDDDTGNRRNIDVNWETLLRVSITKWFGISGFWHLMYDHNTPVPLFEKRDGQRVKVGQGPRLQFKQVLGLALNYRFSTYEEKK